MTALHSTHYASNIDRLNAFLDQFPEGCDSDFDDPAAELDRQLAEFRPTRDDD